MASFRAIVNYDSVWTETSYAIGDILLDTFDEDWALSRSWVGYTRMRE